MEQDFQQQLYNQIRAQIEREKLLRIINPQQPADYSTMNPNEMIFIPESPQTNPAFWEQYGWKFEPVLRRFLKGGVISPQDRDELLAQGQEGMTRLQAYLAREKMLSPNRPPSVPGDIRMMQNPTQFPFQSQSLSQTPASRPNFQNSAQSFLSMFKQPAQTPATPAPAQPAQNPQSFWGQQTPMDTQKKNSFGW